MKPSNNAKTCLFEHSKAKVDLYSQYLSVYLNILSRVAGIESIYIFDMMCGEGIYENGMKGSALSALDKISEFCSANPDRKTPIEIWLNDPSTSEIEPDKNKIDRVQSFAEAVALPDWVKIRYFGLDFAEIYPDVLETIRTHKKSRGLVFIDPNGYRNTKPQQIRALLEGGNSEVLLFVPASFLYRFMSIADDPEFAASAAIKEFIFELYSQKPPVFSTVNDFVKDVKCKFQEYLNDLNIYVDTFTIERDQTNLYCLYFFTSSLRGFQKMLEVKWKMDDQRGKGFRINKTDDLFPDIEINEYPVKVLAYLKSKPYRTNSDLRHFGYTHSYLPQHTKQAIDSLRQKGIRIEVSALDNKPVKLHSYYLHDERRTVAIRVED